MTVWGIWLLFLIGLSYQSESVDLRRLTDSTQNNQLTEVVKKNIELIFDEVCRRLPVNPQCFKNKTSDVEVNTLLSIFLTLQDDWHELNRGEALSKLLNQMLKKVDMCYDSDVFIKRRLEIYEDLEDGNMKSCIVNIVRDDLSDEKCSAHKGGIYEELEIDGAFLETMFVTGAKALSDDTEKCIEAASDKGRRLLETTMLMFRAVNSHNRERFRNFYLDSINSSLKCFNQGRNQLSSRILETRSYEFQALVVFLIVSLSILLLTRSNSLCINKINIKGIRRIKDHALR